MEGIIDACTTCPCVHSGYAYIRAAALHLRGSAALTCKPNGACQALSSSPALDQPSASQAGSPTDAESQVSGHQVPVRPTCQLEDRQRNVPPYTARLAHSAKGVEQHQQRARTPGALPGDGIDLGSPLLSQRSILQSQRLHGNPSACQHSSIALAIAAAFNPC